MQELKTRSTPREQRLKDASWSCVPWDDRVPEGSETKKKHEGETVKLTSSTQIWRGHPGRMDAWKGV